MHSQMRRKTGKSFKNQKDEDWDDWPLQKKKKNDPERKRRYKQNLRRVIDDGDYEELEDFYK